MSSILKALKKLEDEKTTRRPDTLKIDSDILRTDSTPRYSTAGIILVALLLFAGGSVATYLYMKQGFSPGVAGTKTPSAITRTVQSPPPVSAVPEIKTEQLPEAITVVPTRQSGPSKAVPPKPQKQTAPVKSARVGVIRPVVPVKPDEPRRIPTSTSVQQPAAVTAVPTLKVHGIAFQGSSSTDNVAVVNGAPVSNGSTIEGVKVEDIQKDRVRFSYKGETFDIPLGKSNR